MYISKCYIISFHLTSDDDTMSWNNRLSPHIALLWNNEPLQLQMSFLFTFCWPCIFLWFSVNDQLDAQFFTMCLFQFSTCFEQPCAHHQENQLYQYNIWYMSLCVGDQMLYWYNWFSWWWAQGCSIHVENWNKHIGKKQWRIQDFFRGFQQIQLRTDDRENGDLGVVAP
jgi:hypothetical protein